MMINVTVSAEFDGSVAEIYTRMNPLVAGAQLLWHTGGRAVFATANNERFVITGSNLEWGKAAGGTSVSLLAGDVESLTWRKGAQNLVTFAVLQTTGDVLWAAFDAGMAGRDPDAVIDLLARHCWTYHGSMLGDVFPEADTGTFGILDLPGNDRIHLNGGDDVFFTGSAMDTLLGGTGNDLLSGGTENDRLIGGAGNDQLQGGDDDDRLIGGGGMDDLSGGGGGEVLVGGAGRDRIAGGNADDLLTGGGQADVFVFSGGARADVITDFQVGVDHLQFDWTRRIDIVAHGADTEIVYGRNTLLLSGVGADEISLADFL